MPEREASRPSDSLDHPRREAIYEVVSAEPGLNWSQIQRETGISVGSLMFHLNRMEDDGALVRRPSPSGNEVLFFTDQDVELWRNAKTRLLFGNRSTRRIAEILAEEPGISTAELADRLGVTTTAIRYHLGKLDDHELLERHREGRRILYEPTIELEEWLRSVLESG